MKAKKSVSMKVLVLMMALVLVIGCGIGGTLAYLMAKTTDVVNTFVVGDIGDLTLTETGDDGGTDHKYTVTPGVNIKKNPVVKYTPPTDSTTTTSVPVYVFVKIAVNNKWTVSEKSYSTAGGKISWTVADSWTPLTGETGVFYTTAAKGADIANMAIMEPIGTTDKTIEVSSDIVKADVAGIAADIGSITFTAYAIQQEGFETAAAAWTQAQTAT